MSFRVNNDESSDDERTPFRYWNTRQLTTVPTLTSTSNPYSRVGRNPRNPTPLQTSVFSRPPSRAGPGTGTSGSASFHSFEQESESETGPTDEVMKSVVFAMG